MKPIILFSILSLLPAVTFAQSRHSIIKLSAGWYSLNDHDAAEALDAATGKASFAADFQYFGSRHWGAGIHGEMLDDVFLLSPDLLCRFHLPTGQHRGVYLTAVAGLYSVDFSDGVLPSAHCGLELDVPLSDHWGLGVSYRLLGVIGASVSNFGANVVYSF